MSKDLISQEKFKEVLGNYVNKYKKIPATPQQLLNFARDNNLLYRYGQMRKAFGRWEREQKILAYKNAKEKEKKVIVVVSNPDEIVKEFVPAKKSTPGEAQNVENNNGCLKGDKSTTSREIDKNKDDSDMQNMDKNAGAAEKEINVSDSRSNNNCDGDAQIIKKTLNWNDLWNEYLKDYKYPPKQSKHLWNFALEKGFPIQFKLARIAFSKFKDVHKKQYQQEENPETPGKEKVKMISQELFNDLVEKYTKQYKSPPKSRRQLFNFAMEEKADCSICYGAVSKAWNRSKLLKHINENEDEKDKEADKSSKRNVNNDGEANKLKAIDESMFKEIMCKYQKAFAHLPKDALQLLNFALDVGFHVRYGAIRKAWSKFQNIKT